MYTRQHIWQNSIIDLQSENNWENHIVLGYACIDFRFKLIGYGWKENSTDSNIPILYQGRYDIYYKKQSEESWIFLTSVISDRADYSTDYVYEDIFITSGLLELDLYEIKIIAVNAPEFNFWGGTLEGISINSQFWYELKIKKDKNSPIYGIENLYISEHINIGLSELNIEIYETLNLFDYNYYPIFDLTGDNFFIDEIIVSEYVNFYNAILTEIYEEISISEFNNVSFPILYVYKFDDIGISEAINNEEPTNLIFKLEHTYIIEYISIGVDILENIFDIILIYENMSLYLDKLFVNKFETISLVEDISTYMPIRFWVFETPIISENVTIQKYDLISKSVYDSLSISEVPTFELVNDTPPVWETFSGVTNPSWIVKVDDYLYIFCGQCTIVKMKTDGTEVTTFTGSPGGSGTGEFYWCGGISYDSVSEYFYIYTYGDEFAMSGHMIKTKLDGSWTGWTRYTLSKVYYNLLYKSDGWFHGLAANTLDSMLTDVVKFSDLTSFTDITSFTIAGLGGANITCFYLDYDVSNQYYYIANTSEDIAIKTKWNNVSASTIVSNSPIEAISDSGCVYDTEDQKFIITFFDEILFNGFLLRAHDFVHSTRTSYGLGDGTGEGYFSGISGITFDETFYYICDKNNNRIVKLIKTELVEYNPS